MSDLTLDEKLKLPVLDLIINNNGFETVIRIDDTEENRHRSISAGDIVLDYNKRKFEENPKNYLSEQLEAHRMYAVITRARLNTAYIMVNKDIESEMDFARKQQFLPEHLHPLFFQIVKWIVTPLCWAAGTTLKGIIEERIEYNKLAKIEYDLLSSICAYGNNLFNELKDSEISTDPTTKDAIDECASLTQDLKLLYSRLIGTSDKTIAATERWYKALFPKEALQINKEAK